MDFGIWSNGFRRRTSPAQTFQTDLDEIVLADQLGFRDCYISEHHAEPIYVGKVDTLPVPELLMCKAAAMTEDVARTVHLAMMKGEPAPIPPEEVERAHKRYLEKYGQD